MSKKINPFAYKIPDQKSETRTFTQKAIGTDGKEQVAELEITLHSLSSQEQYYIADIQQEAIGQYIGYPNGPKRSKTFPDIGGRRVAINRQLIANAVTVCVMQGPGGDKLINPLDPSIATEHYTLEQMIGIAVTLPSIWGDMVAFSNELVAIDNSSEENQEGKGS